VAGAAGENKQVPDDMAVGKTLPDIENDAGGIEEATRQDPEQRDARNVRQHGLSGDDDQPAHCQVNRRGQILEMIDKPEFEENPREGQTPNHTE